MSRLNKVNPDHYTMAGRLSADDLARERMRQGEARPGRRRRKNKAMPPWMANEERNNAGPREEDFEGAEGAEGPEGAESAEGAEGAAGDKGAEAGVGAAGAERAARARGAAKRTGSDRSEITARKGKRPAPRRKVTGATVKTAKRKSTKASGAKGTPKTRKAPKARASAARGSSKQRAGAPGMRKGRAKGSGVTRRKQKKNRS
jgi:hypothetical protein